MRARIAWLVAATTSAVILGFVIPLCLLVRAVAHDRALAGANEEARNVAILVSGLHESPQLPSLVAAIDQRDPGRTSVVTPEGDVLGTLIAGLADDADVTRAAAGDAFTRETDAGMTILIPVVTDDGTFVVRSTISSADLSRGVGRAYVSILLLGVALLAAAVFIAERIARRVSTPVVALSEVARRLSDGELEARAEVTGPSETRQLAEAMNQLAERINELLLAERAAVGDLSHRLRTPVTALRLDVESVVDAELAERLHSHIAILQRTVDAIVRDARRPIRHSMHTGSDASAVIMERMVFWRALAEDQGRPLMVEVPPHPCHVQIDATDMTDVLDVLVDNVFAHTPDDTRMAVQLTDEGGSAVLTVSDAGPGIAETAAAGVRPGSSGLGLQIVRRSVAGFGGQFDIDSAPSFGTTVRVTLPMAPVAHAGTSPSRTE